VTWRASDLTPRQLETLYNCLQNRAWKVYAVRRERRTGKPVVIIRARTKINCIRPEWIYKMINSYGVLSGFVEVAA